MVLPYQHMKEAALVLPVLPAAEVEIVKCSSPSAPLLIVEVPEKLAAGGS